jgi:hypothetical protein
MIRLLLPLLLLAGLLWALARYRGGSAQQRSRIRRGAYGLAVLLVVVLVLRATGLHPLAVLGTALLAIGRLAWRLLPLLSRVASRRASGSPSPNGDPGQHDSQKMDRARALEVLGLEPDATTEDIQAKHRQLIRDVHPDKGGSTYLTQQINQARDVLLA